MQSVVRLANCSAKRTRRSVGVYSGIQHVNAAIARRPGYSGFNPANLANLAFCASSLRMKAANCSGVPVCGSVRIHPARRLPLLSETARATGHLKFIVLNDARKEGLRS
jgi:hypothetical protein